MPVQVTRILAIGSESSGNRLLLRILQTAEPALDLALCHHDGSREPHPYTLPHGSSMPAPLELVDELRPDRVIVVMRRPGAQLISAVERGHAPDLVTARRERREADRLLWELMMLSPVPVLQVQYEWLTAVPSQAVRQVGRWLGVRLSLPERVFDGNERWRAA